MYRNQNLSHSMHPQTASTRDDIPRHSTEGTGSQRESQEGTPHPLCQVNFLVSFLTVSRYGDPVKSKTGDYWDTKNLDPNKKPVHTVILLYRSRGIPSHLILS